MGLDVKMVPNASSWELVLVAVIAPRVTMLGTNAPTANVPRLKYQRFNGRLCDFHFEVTPPQPAVCPFNNLTIFYNYTGAVFSHTEDRFSLNHLTAKVGYLPREMGTLRTWRCPPAPASGAHGSRHTARDWPRRSHPGTPYPFTPLHFYFPPPPLHYSASYPPACLALAVAGLSHLLLAWKLR